MLARSLFAAAVVTALGLGPAAQTRAEYVRDGITINMREQPNIRSNRVRYLRSGDRVTKLGEDELWARVRSEDKKQDIGWVEKRFLVKKEPPSLILPRVENRLSGAQEKIQDLEKRLAAQSSAISEVESLRSRNVVLETENLQLAGSARWKSMGIGAAIALGGLIVGVLWPRGSARAGRRIKL